MNVVGFVSKHMFHAQQQEIIGIDLKRYKLPVKELTSIDIGKQVIYDENTKSVLLEPLKNKICRSKTIYTWERLENRPIVNINTNDNGRGY